jgi:hypothetical protein
MTDATGNDNTHTVVVDPRHPTEIQEGYGPRELALLLYELLGGRTREVDHRRYSPLTSLREAGNAVLASELVGMPHADCESFWRKLVDAQPDVSRIPPPPKQETPVRKYHIPERFLPCALPGKVLNLQTHDAGAFPVRLVTGPRFNIGRSAAMADFVTRILPENEVNDARTNRLSRIHAVLDIDDRQITVRDGNGKNPSVNGTFLDGQTLTSNHPAILPPRGRLNLGDEYALNLILLPAPETTEWEIDNLGAWAGSGETDAPFPTGALVGQPLDGHKITRNAVWLFSEVGFALDATARIVWDTRGRGRSPAAFHYFRGCFWLRNDSLAEPVLVGGDTVLGRGEILPLVPGQSLRIGPQLYSVRLD